MRCASGCFAVKPECAFLALRRGEGAQRPTIRALHGLSRYDETPSTLMIELTPSGNPNPAKCPHAVWAE